MGFTNTFAGVAITSIDAGREWYSAFFGRPPDMEPHDAEAVWKVTADGWVYVVEDADRAGSSLVTLLVDDLDERLAALSARGIAAGPVEVVAGSTRTTVVEDPDGNRIQLGEPPPTA